MSLNNLKNKDFMIKMPTTGIPKLDNALMEGIPKGYSMLIIGASGSGTELFAKQFAGVKTSEKVLYFTTTEKSDEVKEIMKGYRWREDIEVISIATEYYEKVLSKKLESIKTRKGGFTKEDIAELTRSKEHEDVNFLETLIYEISKQKGNYRVAIDSLDFFLEHYQNEEVLGALGVATSHIRYTDGVALFTLAKDVYEKKIENAIATMTDCLIELEDVRVGTNFENRLVIKKVKNRPDKKATFIYSIGEGGISPEAITRIE